MASLALPVALLLAVGAVAGGLPGWGEPHLAVVPRTPDEAARVAAVLAPPADFAAPEPFEDKPAGAATVRARTDADAFSQMSGNMAFDRQMDFKLGNALFRRDWVSAPASTVASDGLGPLFNARACQSCHLKDGRGHPPEGPNDTAVSMLMRLSLPGGVAVDEIKDYLATRPDPVYGEQIQDLSIAGHPAEARVNITYTEQAIALSGGETAQLRAPSYTLKDLGYGPLDDAAMLSPRIAPQMIGLGLLDVLD